MITRLTLPKLSTCGPLRPPACPAGAPAAGPRPPCANASMPFPPVPGRDGTTRGRRGGAPPLLSPLYSMSAESWPEEAERTMSEPRSSEEREKLTGGACVCVGGGGRGVGIEGIGGGLEGQGLVTVC